MTERAFVKPDRPSPEQVAAWRRLGPAEKLALADELRSTALRLHEAWLRQQHPELGDSEIRQRMREYALHGGT